jgi:hypothetical protein
VRTIGKDITTNVTNLTAKAQPGMQKQRSLRIKPVVGGPVQPASTLNCQSQRLFSKDPNNVVGTQLMQKHANIIQTLSTQQSSTSVPKQKKSASILIPRGTYAPAHKTQMDLSRQCKPQTLTNDSISEFSV